MTITAPAPTTGARAPLTHAERKAWNREFARLARLAGTVPAHHVRPCDDECLCGASYAQMVLSKDGWPLVTERRDGGFTERGYYRAPQTPARALAAIANRNVMTVDTYTVEEIDAEVERLRELS